MGMHGRFTPSGALARKWDHPDPQSLERLQMEKLRRHLREKVLPFHPHYREKLAGLEIDALQTYADMDLIPFSSKSDVAPTAEHPDRPKSFVLQPDAESVKKVLTLSLIHISEPTRRS